MCGYCGKKFPSGTEMVTESGIFEESPFRRYCCLDCMEIEDAFWESVDYECGDLVEYFCEFVKDGSSYDGGTYYGVDVLALKEHAKRIFGEDEEENVTGEAE